MNGARLNRGGWTAGVLALVVGAALATAQPTTGAERDDGDGPPPPPPGAGGESGPGRGTGMGEGLLRQLMELPPEERVARFREMLELRRARAERAQQALDRAIKSIDEGSSIQAVINEFPADLRGEWRPGGGRGMGGPPGSEGMPGGPGAGMPEGQRGDSLEKLNELGPVVPGDEPAGPGGRGPGRGPGLRDGRTTVTDADREVFDEFLGSAAPRLQVMMRELREKDPARADRKIVEAMPRMQWLIEMREKDREMYDLRLRDVRAGREAFDAARGIAQLERDPGDETRRNKLEGELRSALESQYDVRGQILAREIARMDGDLSKRREELARRSEGKAPTIERMSQTLIERAKEMGRRMRDRRGPRGDGMPQGHKPPDR